MLQAKSIEQQDEHSNGYSQMNPQDLFWASRDKTPADDSESASVKFLPPASWIFNNNKRDPRDEEFPFWAARGKKDELATGNSANSQFWAARGRKGAHISI